MEKRLLIAFLLSFLVLSAWSLFNPSPQPKRPPIAEDFQNKADFVASEAFLPEHIPQDVAALPEKTVILENSKIKVEFSNIGGTIKSITIKEHNVSLPVTQIFDVSNFESVDFVLNQVASNKIEYVAHTENGKILKQYQISEDDYLIYFNVHSEELSNLNIGIFSLDTSRLDKNISKSQEKSLFEYFLDIGNQVIRKSGAFEFSSKETKEIVSSANLLGFRDQYFCIIVKPKFISEKIRIVPEKKQLLKIHLQSVPSRENIYEAVVFAGPQNLFLLKKYNLGFEKIMAFSNWVIFDTVSKGIYNLIHLIHKIVPNWGVCVILLGLLIFGATYPLTIKGMVSMKKMQGLQPQMKNLQEKYKNDPQKLNKEVVELYKKHGVNPFGGCLPLILQMPIFIGLYQVLWRSVDFKGAKFLWIKDLSAPDRLFILPFEIPGLSNEFNLLPVLMAIIMVFQQKLSAQSMAISDPNQVMQQKMMIVMFPVFLGFIFYKFASGLSLYFTVFYLLSTLAQWRMSKLNREVVK